MGGGSGYGVLGGGKEKTKTDIKRWTPEQQKLAKGFITDYLTPRLGEGLEGYGGILPGTEGATEAQKNIFAAAEGWSPLIGTSKGDIDERVAERLATRRKLMKPQWEKEESLLKEGAFKMGLGSSSDILKSQLTQQEQRGAQEEAFTQGLYDVYERLNLEVTPLALKTMNEVAESQRVIEMQGHQAEFNEYIRTRPEFSPVIDQILAILGMQPVEKGKQQTDYFYWETGGQGGGGTA